MSVLLNTSTLQGITVSLENMNIILIIENPWLNDDCGEQCCEKTKVDGHKQKAFTQTSDARLSSGNGCGRRIVVAKSEKGWVECC